MDVEYWLLILYNGFILEVWYLNSEAVGHVNVVINPFLFFFTVLNSNNNNQFGHKLNLHSKRKFISASMHSKGRSKRCKCFCQLFWHPWELTVIKWYAQLDNFFGKWWLLSEWGSKVWLKTGFFTVLLSCKFLLISDLNLKDCRENITHVHGM